MIIQNDVKSFLYELNVSQGDITPYRNVSFINYARWCNIARDTLLNWNALGFEENLIDTYEIEISRFDVRYIKESRLPSQILIKINSSNIGNEEFDLLFAIIQKKDNSLISHAKQVLKIYDLKQSKYLLLSPRLINNILKPIETDEKIWLNRQK